MLLRPLARAALLVALLAPAISAQTEGEVPPGEAAVIPTNGEPRPGDRTLTTRLSFYNNGDSGDGNPFLDEALTVVEPVIIFDHQVSEDFGYSVDFHYDYVSSASIDRLSNFPEQSGASADNYIGGASSGRWKLADGWRAGGSTSSSRTTRRGSGPDGRRSVHRRRSPSDR